MINKTLNAYATFTGEEAEQVEKAKTELKKGWRELILLGIEKAREER